MIRFDETLRGRKFFEADLPRLIKSIEANTAELKRMNDLKEAELYPNHTRGGNDESSKG